MNVSPSLLNTGHAAISDDAALPTPAQPAYLLSLLLFDFTCRGGRRRRLHSQVIADRAGAPVYQPPSCKAESSEAFIGDSAVRPCF